MISLRVSPLCFLLYLRAAGIAESYDTGNLVKGLSRRIVNGPP